MTKKTGRTLSGIMEIDGKKQTFEAADFLLQVDDTDPAARDNSSPTTVSDSFAFADGKLVTSHTVTSGGVTTTTTTTTDGTGTTTTTTRTDGNGTTTTIEIGK